MVDQPICEHPIAAYRIFAKKKFQGELSIPSIYCCCLHHLATKHGVNNRIKCVFYSWFNSTSDMGNYLVYGVDLTVCIWEQFRIY